MNWVFLSPHFDDAAFSCGGLIWESTAAGDLVQVWTVCGGEIPRGELSPFAKELHDRWQTGREAVGQRQREDTLSCWRLGAAPHWFNLPDCVYRRAGENYLSLEQDQSSEDLNTGHLYSSNEDIFGPIHPLEIHLVDRLSQEFAARRPEGAELVCPLAIGGHIDHRLVRAAAEMLNTPLWYYADIPYVLENWDSLETSIDSNWKMMLFPITPAGLEAWFEGIAAHASQISTFWEDLRSVHGSLELFINRLGGMVLWRTGD